MLTLTRKPGQIITVKTPSGSLTMVIKKVRGNEVRLGLEAPKYITIHRDEPRAEEGLNTTFASIEKCPRCGLSHLAIEVQQLVQDLPGKKEHFATCPKTGHPIIL